MRRRLAYVIAITPVLLAGILLGGCSKLSGDDEHADGGLGSGCTKTSECNGSYRCINGACGPGGMVAMGRRCSTTPDCQNGLYCSLGQICAAPTVQGRLGDLCLSDDQCTASLRCEYGGFNGTCVQAGQTELGDNCNVNTDCIAGSYCGAARECQIFAQAFPKFMGAQCTDDSSFKAYFEVPRPGKPPTDFYRLPYPNDVRVTTSSNRKNIDLSDFPRPGVIALGVDLVDLYVDTLVEDFDGFGANAPVSFRFSQDINLDFLQTDLFGFIKIVDATANAQQLSIALAYTTDKSLYSCRNFLSIIPDRGEQPFKANHTYFILIKRAGVKAASGGALVAQDADLGMVLAAARPTGDDALGHAWDVYAPVRKYMGENGIMPADVATAAVFTIGDTSGHMARLATAVAAEPPPVLSDLFLCGSGGTDPCEAGDEKRKCGSSDLWNEVHGKMKMPLYQTGTPPYEKPTNGGGLNESNGVVTKVMEQDVCFALTLPKAAAPGDGFPLVVYSHGTGGNYRSFIADGVADQLAKATPKIAMLSFDSVGHGPRRGTSTRKPDELVFNVLNPRAARDNFLQGAADIMTALKFPSSAIPSGFSGVTIKLAGKPAFYGHSQGSTSGELALPFTEQAGAAVLSGAGANLALSLITKTSPISVPDGLTIILGEKPDGVHPVIGIWSNFFDRSDPANYDRLINQTPPSGHKPKHLFMSWGVNDTYAPAPTLASNAVFLGTPPVNPVLQNGNDLGPAINRPVKLNYDAPGGKVTAAVFQYNPDGYDGHFVAWRNPTAAADITAFLTSWFASGQPNVP